MLRTRGDESMSWLGERAEDLALGLIMRFRHGLTGF